MKIAAERASVTACRAGRDQLRLPRPISENGGLSTGVRIHCEGSGVSSNFGAAALSRGARKAGRPGGLDDRYIFWREGWQAVLPLLLLAYMTYGREEVFRIRQRIVLITEPSSRAPSNFGARG